MEKEEEWICEYCGREFDSKRSLLGHQNLQCNEKKEEEEHMTKVGELYLAHNSRGTGMVLTINGIDIPVDGTFEVQGEDTYISIETYF